VEPVPGEELRQAHPAPGGAPQVGEEQRLLHPAVPGHQFGLGTVEPGRPGQGPDPLEAGLGQHADEPLGVDEQLEPVEGLAQRGLRRLKVGAGVGHRRPPPRLVGPAGGDEAGRYPQRGDRQPGRHHRVAAPHRPALHARPPDAEDLLLEGVARSGRHPVGQRPERRDVAAHAAVEGPHVAAVGEPVGDGARRDCAVRNCGLAPAVGAEVDAHAAQRRLRGVDPERQAQRCLHPGDGLPEVGRRPGDPRPAAHVHRVRAGRDQVDDAPLVTHRQGDGTGG
jgi:hypothetical protein